MGRGTDRANVIAKAARYAGAGSFLSTVATAARLPAGQKEEHSR
jgi:hypothetical protein